MAWEEVFLILLPLPTSNNESICVQATLFDTERNQEVKKYEEWGYLNMELLREHKKLKLVHAA